MADYVVIVVYNVLHEDMGRFLDSWGRVNPSCACGRAS